MNHLEQTLIRVHNSHRPTSSRVRYWGSEFEHPHAGDFAHLLGALVWEAKHDGTIPEASGKCECGICAHTCNCRHCTNRYNTCHNAGKNEVTMSPLAVAWGDKLTEYIEALGATGLDPEDYSEWCNDCECLADDCGCDYDLDDKSAWGFHTHIDARDLTLRQVATAVRLANRILDTWEGAFGYDGYTTSYASEEDLERIVAGATTWGRERVNANGIVNYLDRYAEADRQDPTHEPDPRHKATIEFRQFRYTGNAELHNARVATARSIVDYAKAGKPVFWLLRETDFEKVLTELEIWAH